MRLLLLSNSTSPGKSYLEHSTEWFKDFLPPGAKIAFVPFAGVTISWDDYTEKFNQYLSSLGMTAIGVHQMSNPVREMADLDAIAVGGGNTFYLLKQLYDQGFINPIRQMLTEGMPYIGWSAGSNIAGPHIYTTNDMPVVEPPSFEGLKMIPFQINPHYTEEQLPNHHGETRLQRLMEYVELHPKSKVLGLPEGSAIKLENEEITLLGERAALITYGRERQWINELSNLISREI